MTLYRAYRLSKTALQELREAGLNEVILTALQAKGTSTVYGRKEFRAFLQNLGPKQPDKEEIRAIMQHSQLSLLRLEKLIGDRSTREWVEALIIAFMIAILVRTFFFAPFRIPSGSMLPTIQEGDHIFASVFSYGTKIPFTDIRLFASPVQRGDIVIFPFPHDPNIDYIKRVVALPGEKVEVRNDKVFINDQPLEESYSFHDSTAAKVNDFGPRQVPQGHFFVMGDNRYRSSDSRFWGFVKEETVVGKGQIVYWSHNPTSGWFEGYRFDRIAKMLE